MHQNQTLKLEKMTRDQRKPTHVTSNKESRDHIKSILVAASGLLSLGDNSFDGITNKPQEIKSQQDVPSFPSISEGDYSLTFPEKLMKILSTDGVEGTITWLPHGRSFTIINPKALTSKLLPKYFKKTQFTSFTRKLSRWGFQRHAKGVRSGVYYHRLFQRDNKTLCLGMRCIQNKKPAIANRIHPKQVRFGSAQIKALPCEESNTHRKPSEHSLTISRDDLNKMAIRATNYRMLRSTLSTPLFSQCLKLNSFPHGQPYSPEASTAIISAALDALDRSASRPITKKTSMPSMTNMHQQMHFALKQARGNQSSANVKRALAA